MSKQERVSWLSLAVNLVIGFYYFSAVFALAASGEIYGPAMAGLILKLVILAVIVGIAGEIVLRILAGAASDKIASDERDKLISAKAMRNGYIVLTVGVAALTSHIVVVGGLDRFSADYPIAKPTMDFIGTVLHPLAPIVIAQFLLLASMTASTAIYASRIFYYRRGY
jgi:hypothetical protein